MATIHWSSEVKTVTNEHTGLTRYFIRCCDVWRRVSRADYYALCTDANRSDSYLTRIKGHLIHQHKTVYGIHTTKRG